MAKFYPRKQPAPVSVGSGSPTNPSSPREPISPIQRTSEPSMWEPGPFTRSPGFVLVGSGGEESPTHSRHSSDDLDTTNPFVEAMRAESPHSARPRTNKPLPPAAFPPPELTDSSPRRPAEEDPVGNSRLVSIMPGGLDVVNMEEQPETANQKDTWGSHTVYTFRVR